MQLHLRLTFAVFLCALFLITGCDKEDTFKNPADVGFNVGMNPQGIAPSDDLTFFDGYVILHRFTLIGKRAVGEDFEFSRTFPNGLKVPFYNNLTFEDLNFELPQGTYTNLTVRFETRSSSLPGVFVEGNYDYNNPLKPSSTVHLAWNAAKTFEVAVQRPTGSNDFVLSETKQELAQIIFQPKRWFVNVTELMLENASFVTTPSQEQIMTIDQVTNIAIFTAIDSEIGGALSATL
ncbi:MAG: Unknown protein [uncultured Aureispira sp.]|uniref:Uncharacterized protein n=1 Tax=uncultured Aureispira sp. TaxID=1331704 RepID=A0A6S6TVI1_9BACT|nr:MAG: Unknown protein [uncultured Aureispira sp.]